MLQAKNISKSFPGVKALDSVNMSFHEGKVTAILGENGAGKSTLLKIMSGIYPEFEGEILIKGEKKHFANINDSRAAGIAIIHQELNLIAELDIAENMFLGEEITNGWGLLDRPRMLEIAQTSLEKVGLRVSPKTKVKDLKIGEQQLVEIAKALLFDANIIFMDEPTSALSNQEIEKLHDIIKQLRKDGKIIVYISHKMDELFSIADRYEVLRDGVSIGSGDMTDSTEENLVKMMVGREVKIIKKEQSEQQKEAFLEIENLNLLRSDKKSHRLKNINFGVKKGEVLGIFGLMGAGRSELLSTIFGLNPELSSFKILIANKSISLNKPEDAINNGIAFLTEDRKAEGLVLNMDIASNISLTTLASFDFLRPKQEIMDAENYASSLSIKAPNVKTIVQNLSGGNQQKVVIAKWLNTNPQLLLMDEPTRGIDINAKNEIYKLIEELSSKGMSIIVASSEIPELLAISDRILVMADGQITGEVLAKDANEEMLLRYAIKI